MYRINNFVNSCPVCVNVCDQQDASQCKVIISQHQGACSFVHGMTAEQARDMAAALIACAEKAKEVQA